MTGGRYLPPLCDSMDVTCVTDRAGGWRVEAGMRHKRGELERLPHHGEEAHATFVADLRKAARFVPDDSDT